MPVSEDTAFLWTDRALPLQFHLDAAEHHPWPFPSTARSAQHGLCSPGPEQELGNAVLRLLAALRIQVNSCFKTDSKKNVFFSFSDHY